MGIYTRSCVWIWKLICIGGRSYLLSWISGWYIGLKEFRGDGRFVYRHLNDLEFKEFHVEQGMLIGLVVS